MELGLESLESPALTKAALADMLYDNIGLNKREAKDMVDALFDIITGHLVSGDDVKITGFGNFQIRSPVWHSGTDRPIYRRLCDLNPPRSHPSLCRGSGYRCCYSCLLGVTERATACLKY